jgi:hypothetical protein
MTAPFHWTEWPFWDVNKRWKAVNGGHKPSVPHDSHVTEGEMPMAQAQPIDQAFPHLAEWVTTHGWIEIGYDDDSRSFVRALDSGGMVWEGQDTYTSLDDALRAADTALGTWIKENFGGA